MSKMFMKTIGAACLCAVMAMSTAAGAFAATGAPELPEVGITEPVTEPVSANVSEIKMGDTNKNGSLDVADATNVQLYCAYQMTFDAEQMITADINKDGIVDITDASLIQLMVANVL